MKLKKLIVQFKSLVRRRPFLATGLMLLVFLGLMFLGRFLRRPAPAATAGGQPLPVKVFSVGAPAKISLDAQAKKASVVEIVAQTSGVAGKINFQEGNSIKRGQTLLSINSSYGVGNTLSVQRQIAGKQKDNAEATYPDQIRLIDLQRQLANDTATSTEDLRDISQKALDDTRSLITLNEEIVNTLNSNLSQYTATNSAGANDTAILSTRQLINQYRSALATLQNSARTSEYQLDEDKIPANLPNLQKEITLANLNIQEKAYTLAKEVTGLQYQLAVLAERLSAPIAPASGRVERVHVLPNQIVNPGQVLMTISTTEAQPLVVEAFVPQNLANSVNSLEPSLIEIDGQNQEIFPEYVSAEAVEGRLYLIKYVLPEDWNASIGDGAHLSILVPLSNSQSSGTVPFIPLEAVYQTQQNAYIYVVDNNLAQVRNIGLGQVRGGFVEITDGLNESDTIILDRSVIAGQAVSAE